jgi:hypothetical protein
LYFASSQSLSDPGAASNGTRHVNQRNASRAQLSKTGIGKHEPISHLGESKSNARTHGGKKFVSLAHRKIKIGGFCKHLRTKLLMGQSKIKSTSRIIRLIDFGIYQA